MPISTNRMDLVGRIEGVLFYKAAPMKISALARFFAVDEGEVRAALEALSKRLQGGAVTLTLTDKEAQLTTASEVAGTIEELRKDEMKRDIGKAGAETLAIILYRGPLTRTDIDHIRGVNSTFILRNLLIRGLIEKRENPRDKRSSLYAATPSLFAHLGITKREELPEFTAIMDALDVHEQNRAARETTEESVFQVNERI